MEVMEWWLLRLIHVDILVRNERHYYDYSPKCLLIAIYQHQYYSLQATNTRDKSLGTKLRMDANYNEYFVQLPLGLQAADDLLLIRGERPLYKPKVSGYSAKAPGLGHSYKIISFEGRWNDQCSATCQLRECGCNALISWVFKVLWIKQHYLRRFPQITRCYWKCNSPIICSTYYAMTNHVHVQSTTLWVLLMHCTYFLHTFAYFGLCTSSLHKYYWYVT